MADCTPMYDIECDLQNSSTISWLKAKDQQLQTQVNDLKHEINKRDPEDWGWRGIKQRLDDVEACCEDKQDQINQVNTVISEMGDNITLLKGMSTRQDKKIKSLLRNVILDEIYLNFSDRVENVYLPQWESLENKYTQWDIYINVNQKIWATNAVYICVRSWNSKKPLSANDWQELYYSAPADVISILGIDPVKVMHPYKHERVISIDPDKLGDLMANMKTLDLSKVDVTLWDVYFNPMIKESVTIQENLTVWWETTVNILEWKKAHIKSACIDEMTCDTKFTWTPEFVDAKVTWTLDTHDVVSDVATIGDACIEHMTCNTNFKDVIPEFNTANFGVQINTKRIDWEWAHFKKACIEEMVCDTKVTEFTADEWDIKVANVETLIQTWGTAEFNWPVEFNWTVELNVVEWDTTFNDVVNAPDVNISNNTKTENITVNNVTELNWPVNINWYINYKDEWGQNVCIGNVMENLFRPSFWLFWIEWSWMADASNGDNNILFWLGSDAVGKFNDAQWANKVKLIPLGGSNNSTELHWDSVATTPGVEMISFGNGSAIQINWDNWEDAGIYTIHFNMTIEFDDISDNTPMNIWSHRAGVVVYDEDNIGEWWFIIDDKTTAAEQLFKYEWTHKHSYFDSDTWEYSSWSRTRESENVTFKVENPDRCNPSNGWSDVVLRCGNHYTYTKTLTIPVTKRVIVAPYFKPSAGCANKGVHLKFNIPTWVWNTGSRAQIWIKKEANLWRPKEYHC